MRVHQLRFSFEIRPVLSVCSGKSDEGQGTHQGPLNGGWDEGGGGGGGDADKEKRDGRRRTQERRRTLCPLQRNQLGEGRKHRG